MYDKVGGFDKDIPMYEDWDLKIRLSRHYSFLYTGIVGVGYRRHGKGLSSVDTSRHKKFMEIVVKKNRSLIQEDEYDEIVNKIPLSLSAMVESPFK